MLTCPSSKIFGIGLSKTGTTSLHAALVLMGFPAVHYFHPESWLEGDFTKDELTEFDAATDLPVPAYYAELDHRYPGSKFIYTVRHDRDAWLRSLERQWQSIPPHRNENRGELRLCVYRTRGFSRVHMSQCYETHDRSVREYFRGRLNDFLILDVFNGDRWEKLSRFLGRPAPSLPFPALKPDIGDLAAVRKEELAAKRGLLQRLVVERTSRGHEYHSSRNHSG